jgi:hypothetical protein
VDTRYYSIIKFEKSKKEYTKLFFKGEPGPRGLDGYEGRKGEPGENFN